MENENIVRKYLGQPYMEAQMLQYELNIYSLGKIYGQCENLILIICKENIWAVKKKEMQPLLFFFDEIKCFVSANKMCYSMLISILSFVKIFILFKLF